MVADASRFRPDYTAVRFNRVKRCKEEGRDLPLPLKFTGCHEASLDKRTHHISINTHLTVHGYPSIRLWRSPSANMKWACIGLEYMGSQLLRGEDEDRSKVRVIDHESKQHSHRGRTSSLPTGQRCCLNSLLEILLPETAKRHCQQQQRRICNIVDQITRRESGENAPTANGLCGRGDNDLHIRRAPRPSMKRDHGSTLRIKLNPTSTAATPALPTRSN